MIEEPQKSTTDKVLETFRDVAGTLLLLGIIFCIMDWFDQKLARFGMVYIVLKTILYVTFTGILAAGIVYILYDIATLDYTRK